MKSVNARKHGWPEQSVAVKSIRQTLADLDWSKVFKLSFMYLFFCYPGITLKLLRVFKCQAVEGVQYLSADLRLQCYTAQWAGFAAYAGVMLALYTVGLPVGVFLVLWHRRHKLYGANSERTRVSWGFLYESYGAGAWFWEVQEMLRKLFLTSFVVILNAHSPLQVTLAVLVSFWAHTLHSLYEPWGYGSQTYMLQHLFSDCYVICVLDGSAIQIRPC